MDENQETPQRDATHGDEIKAKFSVDAFGERIEVAPDLFVQSRIKATVTGDGPYDLDLVIEYVGDKFVCTSMTTRRQAGGEVITGEGLRKIPVSRWVSAAVRAHAMRVKSRSDRAVSTVPLVSSWGDPREFSKRGPVDDVLREVAAVYRLAYVLNEPPLKEVQQTFGLPRSTASRWISTARDKGFLGASEGRGKAGGVHPEPTPEQRQARIAVHEAAEQLLREEPPVDDGRPYEPGPDPFANTEHKEGDDG